MKLLQKKKTCIAGAILFAFLAIAFMNPKSARASDYASAQTLPLNGAWSSEYWLKLQLRLGIVPRYGCT